MYLFTKEVMHDRRVFLQHSSQQSMSANCVVIISVLPGIVSHFRSSYHTPRS